MALENTNGNGFYMPVAPTGGNNGGWGGDMAWLVILLLACGGMGWGGLGGYGGGMGGMFFDYPWIANGQQQIQMSTANGFRDQALNTGINSIQNAVTSGFGDMQTALCGGFAGVNSSISNGFAQAEIAANAREIAALQQSFAVQSALQNCCCENRASIADLKATLAAEACASRATSTANTQRILDMLCNQDIEAKRDRILDLERQLSAANLAASQTAQTAAIIDALRTTTTAAAAA